MVQRLQMSNNIPTCPEWKSAKVSSRDQPDGFKGGGKLYLGDWASIKHR